MLEASRRITLYIVLDKYNQSNKVLLVVSLESLPHDKKPEDLNENYELF